MRSIKKRLRPLLLRRPETRAGVELALRWRARARSLWQFSRRLLRFTERVRVDRAAAKGSNELVPCWYRGRWGLAKAVERVDYGALSRSNIELTMAALDASEVDYFVLPTTSSTRLVLDSEDKDEALRALAHRGDAALMLFANDPLLPGKLESVDLHFPTRRDRRTARNAPVWLVCRNLANHDRLPVDAAKFSCEVEFWDASSDGRALVAPRWNPHAAEIGRDGTGSASLRVGNREVPTSEPFVRAPHVSSVDFPIDVVYTWVDGGDPAWLERKHAVLRELDLQVHTSDATDLSRFASRDELRYSLRSVAAFAPWIRTIFVVTDDQVPDWLDTSHPKVRVVDHKEIFGDVGRLPTFNSHAIESRLHHIEGLAEHYVYMNDDFFLGRPLEPTTFFHPNGVAKFFLSSALMGAEGLGGPEESVNVAARNGRELLLDRFGRLATQKFKHAPYPQRRSVLMEMEEAFAEAFARTAANQVRSTDDIAVPSSLSHYYGLLTGRSVPAGLGNRYVDLADPNFDRVLEDLVRARDFDTLCINDTETGDEDEVRRQAVVLARFLERYWPVRSELERS